MKKLYDENGKMIEGNWKLCKKIVLENEIFDFLDSLKRPKYENINYVDCLMKKFNLSSKQAKLYNYEWVLEKMKKIPFGTYDEK